VPISFSPREQEFIDILKRLGGRATTRELALKRFGRRGMEETPTIKMNIIQGLARNLAHKTRKTRSGPKIVLGPRLGPHPREVILEQ